MGSATFPEIVHIELESNPLLDDVTFKYKVKAISQLEGLRCLGPEGEW